MESTLELIIKYGLGNVMAVIFIVIVFKDRKHHREDIKVMNTKVDVLQTKITDYLEDKVKEEHSEKIHAIQVIDKCNGLMARLEKKINQE